MRMAGKRALVTGAASGIGRAVAALFHQEGAEVISADVEYADTRGNEVHLDVSSENDWEALAPCAGRLDALVACAGISATGPIVDTSLEEWRRVMAVNLDGAFLSVRHGARAMRQAGGGTIVLVGSASGVKPVPQASAYCASKAGVRMLVKSAALELKLDGIRINCVSPAGVVTPMWRKMPFWQDLLRQHGSEEGAWNALGGADANKPSMQRMALPEEVAEAVLFLSCDQSAHITGVDLAVDAGYAA